MRNLAIILGNLIIRALMIPLIVGLALVLSGNMRTVTYGIGNMNSALADVINHVR